MSTRRPSMLHGDPPPPLLDQAVSLADCLGEHARQQGEAAALTDQQGQLSYAELAVAAFGLAGALRSRGVEPGDVVAIAVAAGRDAVIALLAVAAAGAAFFFIDPRERSERVEQLLSVLGVTVILCQGDAPHDANRSLNVAARAAPCSPITVSRDALAYVIRTSGTSGAPKAVRIAHRGVLPMLRAQIAMFGIDQHSRVLLGTPLCFDASVSDIGTALVAGAELFIPPKQNDPALVRAFIEQHRVTHADLPPALMRLFEEPPASLRVTIVGGEVVPADLLRRWAQQCRVIVCYGPSEATVCSSMVEVDPITWQDPEIGAPLKHVHYRLIDPATGAAVADNAAGELWIGGDAIAQGYVGGDSEQQQRFLMADGMRWYRTGDRVRRLDQRWFFLGKYDRRDKIAGRLICPEEIEAVLASMPQILHVAVVIADVPRQGWPPRRSLLAYAVVRTDARQGCDPLRRALMLKLPIGLVPQLRLLDALPTTDSGKPDYQLLRQWAETERPPSSVPIMMQSDVRLVSGAQGDSVRQSATLLARLMAEVLGLPAVDPAEDFVALGGDSMAAIELVAAAELHGLILGTASVMQLRTAERMATSGTSSSLETKSLQRRLSSHLSSVSITNRTDMHPPNLLISGATGLFGSQLVVAWLRRAEGRALCLVRARDDNHAQIRLRQAFARENLPWPEEHRIEAIAGDCTQRGLGLSPARCQRLSDEVGIVVHAAAELSTILPIQDLAQANIDSSANMLAFSHLMGNRPFHLISSLAVLLCGEGAPASIDEQLGPECMTQLHGAYAASKWGAEMLVNDDPFARVHRLGLLLADGRNGGKERQDSLRAFVRGIARVGALPRGDHERLRFDLTPVAQAAEASAALIATAAGGGRYHISSERGASLAQLRNAMQTAGQPVTLCSVADFDLAVRHAPCSDSARAALALSARLRGSPRPDLDLFLLTDRTLNNAHTVATSGILIEEPNAAALDRLIQQSLLGFAS